MKRAKGALRCTPHRATPAGVDTPLPPPRVTTPSASFTDVPLVSVEQDGAFYDGLSTSAPKRELTG